MNGAESLVRTARDAGVDVCFANPGTTELPLVAALDTVGGVRPVLGLFEGVCTGAADGYGRMTGRPALTLLHLGPGLGNGIANLHNARRARTPVVNLVGDQATYHRAYDAPLTSHIAALAGVVSGWVREATSPGVVASFAVEALHAAGAGQVATLILPADTQWGPAEGSVNVPRAPAVPAVPDEAVERAAQLAGRRQAATLLLGGNALSVRGLRAAGRVAAATGWRLACETFPARMERGPGLPAPDRLPYFPERALDFVRERPHLVLAGAAAPVAFFAYPDVPSSLVPDGVAAHALAHPEQDAAAALEQLADAVEGAAAAAHPAGPPAAAPEPADPAAALDAFTVAAALGALQPDGAIVVEEAATTGLAYLDASRGAPPSTYLSLTGGAIGQGPPLAVGAAIACPDRPVVDFQADGSAAYTLQALWTQAREGLDVTTLICANRSYRILQVEQARAGITDPGPAGAGLTDLSRPDLDWVRLAEGMGVPATLAETAGALADQLRTALAEPGPHLVEMVLR